MEASYFMKTLYSLTMLAAASPIRAAGKPIFVAIWRKRKWREKMRETEKIYTLATLSNVKHFEFN
jgi:hypothetical protein